MQPKYTDCASRQQVGSDMQLDSLPIGAIVVGVRLRQLNRDNVDALKESIKLIGLKTPISVREISDRHEADLLAGLHRLTACRELGWKSVPVRRETGTEADARMWEISENLHRAELTALERAEHIEEWRLLAIEKVGQVVPPLGGQQPAEKGVRKVARELGVSVPEVRRAKDIAGLAPETKEEARALKLDDNQSALLEAAKHESPDAQVQALRDKAAAKAEAKARPKPSRKPTTEPREPAAQARSKAISG